jgi:hypothetical protein
MKNKLQIGTSLTGNLQENTWTFEMEEDIWISAGRFAIFNISKISVTQQIELEKFVNNLVP